MVDGTKLNPSRNGGRLKKEEYDVSFAIIIQNHKQ